MSAESAPQSLLQRLFSRKRKIVSVPPGVRVYAMGDIHGRLDLLDTLQKTILQDSSTGPGKYVTVYLGDYVDRGAESKGVVERLLEPPPANFEARFIRGNHDQFFLDFLADPTTYRMWRNYGAQETLLSYGVTPPRFDDDEDFLAARDTMLQGLPNTHFDFFNGLRLSEVIGDYYFVHAGVRPGLPLASQTMEDQISIREDFLESTLDYGKVVVHGHTPSRTPERFSNRIGVDTGAYATGCLSCAVLEAQNCRFLHT